LEVPEPILYLKRVSTGDFEEALAALLGKGARGGVGPRRSRSQGGVLADSIEVAMIDPGSTIFAVHGRDIESRD
jgi:hypothetical protein